VTARPSARQTRANETRARIFASATELFAKHGYHATTVDKIASHAGVAKGTFFIHFPSKGAVIAALVGIQTHAAHKARARALEAHGPIAALRAAVLALGEQAAASRTLSRGVLTATLESDEVGGEATARFDAVFAEMTRDAHAAAKQKLLAAHVEPDTLAGSLMSAYLGAVLHFTSSPNAKPLMKVLEPIVDSHLAGAVQGRKK